jgi:endonuclease/exonuclease/phosphatase (EEP) superfamily protein YafD
MTNPHALDTGEHASEPVPVTIESIKTPQSFTGIHMLPRFAKPFSACSCAAGFLSVASIFEGLDWRLQLLAHWRPHLAICLALAAAILIRQGRRGTGLALAGLAGITFLSALPALRYVQPRVANAAGPVGASYRLASFNVNYGNHGYARVRDWLEENRPDVVILVEMNPRWRRQLSAMSKQYPWQCWTPGKRYGDGIGIFSRYPLEKETVLNPGGGLKMALTARVRLPGAAICRLVGVHPHAPRSYEETRQRDAYLRAVDSMVAGLAEPVVVAGDFNTTPWSYGFRLLTEASGLRGAGLLPTWPAPLAGIGIPIDHVLATKGAAVARLTRGPGLGSDHLPLLAEIGVTGPISD